MRSDPGCFRTKLWRPAARPEPASAPIASAARPLIDTHQDKHHKHWCSHHEALVCDDWRHLTQNRRLDVCVEPQRFTSVTADVSGLAVWLWMTEWISSIEWYWCGVCRSQTHCDLQQQRRRVLVSRQQIHTGLLQPLLVSSVSLQRSVRCWTNKSTNNHFTFTHCVAERAGETADDRYDNYMCVCVNKYRNIWKPVSDARENKIMLWWILVIIIWHENEIKTSKIWLLNFNFSHNYDFLNAIMTVYYNFDFPPINMAL